MSKKTLSVIFTIVLGLGSANALTANSRRFKQAAKEATESILCGVAGIAAAHLVHPTIHSKAATENRIAFGFLAGSCLRILYKVWSRRNTKKTVSKTKNETTTSSKQEKKQKYKQKESTIQTSSTQNKTRTSRREHCADNRKPKHAKKEFSLFGWFTMPNGVRFGK